MRLARGLFAGLALGVLAVAQTAHATAFTDETAWRAAAGAFALETYDSTATGSDVTTLPALGITFDALNDGTQPTAQPYSFTGGVVKSTPNNLLNDRDNTLPGRGPISVRPIVGTDFIFALGLWNVGGDDKLQLSFFDASDTLIESVTSAASSGFFGIINTAGAKRAEVNFVEGNGYAPTDDWQAAARPTFNDGVVPEPSTISLLLIGSGALLLHRYRYVRRGKETTSGV